MTTLGLYFNRLLLRRLSLVMFAVLGFASVFDLLDAIDDVVSDGEHPIISVAIYLVLRAPSLLSQLLPLIALLGGLFFVTDLMRNNELVVTWGMGRSTRQMILKLMPMLVLVAGFKFVLDDQLVPRSVEILRDWKVGSFKRTNIVGSSTEEIWLRSGDDILRIAAEPATDGLVREISLFVRDDRGKLLQRIEASEAQLIDGDDVWRLNDVTIQGRGDHQIDADGSMIWQGSINIEHVKALARPARELTLWEQIDIIRNDGFSIRTTDAYITWANHRLVGSLIPSLLLALVLALARSFSRSGNAISILVPAVALGFSFLIANGVVLALGEVGIFPPLLAAWAPSALLFALISILLLRTNRLVAMRLTPKQADSDGS